MSTKPTPDSEYLGGQAGLNPVPVYARYSLANPVYSRSETGQCPDVSNQGISGKIFFDRRDSGDAK